MVPLVPALKGLSGKLEGEDGRAKVAPKPRLHHRLHSG